MTREEAMNEARDFKLECFNKARNLVIDIYKDFESRTCENCKHYVAVGLSCHNRKNEIVYWSPHEIPKDFGCSKFERKTDGDV